MQNTYLQIICKGIDRFILKTFLKKIISLFLLVTSYFYLPLSIYTEHEFIKKENLKVIYYFSETVEVRIRQSS